MNKFFLALGILCFLVPVILQTLDKNEQNSVIDTYQKEIEVCDEDEIMKSFENAITYNQALYALKQSSVGKEVVLDYMSQLNVTSTGMMGHLEIPKINVRLPIYHGTSEDVLSTGIGHLEGTSLPVGGENVHTVLTGHRGLPSAELFTRLDEMKEGDKFYLHVCKQTLVYEVSEIQVVEPDQVEVLEIKENKDQVSLITCTPYGINTHRMIVTGEHVENVEPEIESESISEGGVDEKVYIIMGVSALLFLLHVSRGIYRKFGYLGK